MDSENSPSSSWLERPLSTIIPRWNIGTLLVILILVAAVVTRFYNLDLRVMSHDEVNHVVPSFDLYSGKGYRQDPVTHGPMQFHLIALSYFLLGDSDFSSRVPAALFSIATIAFVLFAYRRYLGRTGALIAGFLFLISPYMLFYGRYTRNEAFVAFEGVLLIYGVLRYLEKGDRLSLFLVTISLAMHFITKETSYIYAAILLLFLAVLFLVRITRISWTDNRPRERFFWLMVIALLLVGVTLAFAIYDAGVTKAAIAGPADSQVGLASRPGMLGIVIALTGAFVTALVAIVLLVRTLGWLRVRQERSFDLLVLVGTLVLPALCAIPVKLLGWNPTDYTSTTGLLRLGSVIVVLLAISILVGVWWKPGTWLLHAAIFYAIFVTFYTTFFTNGNGFFSGMVGSLPYWMEQQGVGRGGQPWYYFLLIQVPIYEYLPALGTLLAAYFGFRHRLFSILPGFDPARQPVQTLPLPLFSPQLEFDPARQLAQTLPSEEFADPQPFNPEETTTQVEPLPVLGKLLFWSFMSMVAYSLVGEKMPWLTVHVTLPLILTAGFGLGYLVDTTEWKKLADLRGAVVIVLLIVLLGSLGGFLGGLLGSTPPFKGNTLEQLQASSTFLLSLVSLLLSAWGIYRLLKGWTWVRILRLGVIVFFALATILTARAAYMASYVNYDLPVEFMVYAHAARGPKDALAQIEEVSRRLTKGLDAVVAYDNDGLYPYWWYLRNYPNHRFYADQPTRELRDAPLLIVSEASYSKIEPIVKDNYVYFEYMRLWWPMQGYWNLTWERIRYAVTTPAMRQALFDIWLNRDYSLYAQLTNDQSLKLENWQPSNRMRLYIRKDVVAQMWNYGALPVMAEAGQSDPYEKGMLNPVPDAVIGSVGTVQGQFQTPRGVAVAPDGSIYVADSRNHRIQRFSAAGAVLQVWGSFADVSKGSAPGGTFNEPWGVAVGPDGSVFVADTWNYRIQKFTADGKFIKMWGYFGQGEKPEAFWGPRGVAVDKQGRIYVTDTGNKRVVIFNSTGEFVTQFGSAGMAAGQFDEPVGIAVDSQGLVYVADTWNQRVQVFSSDVAQTVYYPFTNWEITGWLGQSLDNKPFLAVDTLGNLYLTDPEAGRVLQFSLDGKYQRGWSDFGAGSDGFNLSAGVAVDAEGRVWVSDAGTGRLLRFNLAVP